MANTQQVQKEIESSVVSEADVSTNGTSTDDSTTDEIARRNPSFISRAMSSLTLLMATIALAVFLCSLFGRFFLVSELMCNFRLQIAGLMLPFAFIVYRMGVWRWLALSLFAAVLFSVVSLGWVFVPVTQPPAGERPLKVMSFNVLGHNWNRNGDIKIIREVDADVLIVLEYSRNWHKKLKPLYEQYPHRVLKPRWHGFGMAVLSKYPLSDTEIVPLTKDKTDNPCIVTNVQFGDQTIRFAGLHSLSPTNGYRYELRNKQFDELANHVAKKEIPTVVVGDFNCTPWSAFLRDFRSTTGYRDSRNGFGYQVSWPVRFPMLRIPIDHAFVSPDVCVHSRKVGTTAGSDHMPIIFEVSTATKAENPIALHASQGKPLSN